ncbi:hypothetical protein ABFS82_14G291700 [Erythranthe guttata]
MKYQRAVIVLIILVFCFACTSKVNVEAARILSDDHFSQANHLVKFPSVSYENAKVSMSYWLQRLASGPSPRGPGH